MVDLADEALYRAKRAGRDRVIDIGDASTQAAGSITDPARPRTR